MIHRYGLSRLALLFATFVSAVPAYSAGRNGLALSADLGGAGGAQMTAASGTPSLKYGAELGAHVNDDKLFVGVYADLFESSVWAGGFTGKQFFGASRIVWVQIKLSLVGWAAMNNTNSSSSSKQTTWTDYIEGGVGVGMRIPMSSMMNLQPYFEFDSFTSIQTLNSLGGRYNIPTAGVRLALEL